MDFKGLSDSLISTIKHRFTNPFFSALIISWIIINWEIVLYIFAPIYVGTKVSHIDVLTGNSCKIMWYPVLSAFVLVLVYPLLGNGSHWVYEYYKRWRKKIDFKINNTAYLPLPEAKALRELAQKKDEEFNEFYRSKIEDIEKLNIELGKRENEYLKLRDELSSLTSQHHASEITIRSMHEKHNRLSSFHETLLEEVSRVVLDQFNSIDFDMLKSWENSTDSELRALVANGYSTTTILLFRLLHRRVFTLPSDLIFRLRKLFDMANRNWKVVKSNEFVNELKNLQKDINEVEPMPDILVLEAGEYRWSMWGTLIQKILNTPIRPIKHPDK